MVTMGKETNRLLALEGLRGIAALMVVVFHVIVTFYPIAFYGPPGTVLPSVQNAFIEDNLYGTPPMALLSGVFAVAIFFVLSGFVLSVGFFQTGNETIVKKLAAKRYLRLMIPALVAVMISWLILTLSLSSNGQAFEITQSGWLKYQWSFDPNFFDALGQGLWGIFATTTNHYYNAVLWTMVYEFIGSFIVFGILMTFGKLEKRWLVYLLLIFLTFQTWFLPFILGMWLADLYANKKFIFSNPSPLLGGLFLVLGLMFGGYPIGGGVTQNTFYESFTIPTLAPTVNSSLYLSIGALLIIGAVLTLPWLSRVLGSKRIGNFGKYTFSIYLVHKPILFTVGTGVFVLLVNQLHWGFHISALVAALSIIPFVIIATLLFHNYVDIPATKFSGTFANWFLGLSDDKNSNKDKG